MSLRRQVTTARRKAQPFKMFGADQPPDFCAASRGGWSEAQITTDIDVALAGFYSQHQRDPKPSEYQQLLTEVALRQRGPGFAPADVAQAQERAKLGMPGFTLPTGRFKGTTIRDAGVMLAAKKADPLDGLLVNEKNEVMLASGSSTKGGGGSGELAPLTGAADKWLYGTTGGVVPISFVQKTLRKKARETCFLPMCEQGIMPDLQFAFDLQINTIIDEIFDTDGKTFKTGVGVPREEGMSTGNYLQSRFSNANLASRGYLWFTRQTKELLSSRVGQMLGIRQKDSELLMQAPAYVTDRDIFLALWYALEVGYTRRYDATGNAWDVATQEIPWGKAEVLTTNAPYYAGWWDVNGGKLYAAAADANARKYGSATPVSTGIIPGAAGTAKLLQAIKYMHWMQAQKNERLDAVWVPQDFLYAMTEDEYWQNALYNASNQRIGLAGEAGYVGNLRLFGAEDEVAIFKYKRGSLPASAAGLLRTTDAPTVDIDDVMFGVSFENRPVTNLIYWPFTMMTYDEQTYVSVDGQNVSQPTLREVVCGYHMEAVEPYNVRGACMLKCMQTAKPA